MGNLTASKLEFRGAAPGSALVDDHASCHYYRHGASSKRGIAIGRCLLCGLLSIGGLLLLFIGSFSDPITALHQMLSASTPTQPVLTEAATAPSSAMTDKSRQSNRDTSMWRLLALASAALRTPQCRRLSHPRRQCSYRRLQSDRSRGTPIGHPPRQRQPGTGFAPMSRCRAVARGCSLLIRILVPTLRPVWSRQSSSHAFCSRMRHACSSAAKCKPWHILIITPLNCASGHCTSASLPNISSMTRRGGAFMLFRRSGGAGGRSRTKEN